MPFFAVALVIELVISLEWHQFNSVHFVLSLVLLGATLMFFFVPRGDRLSWLDLVVPISYTGSTLCLVAEPRIGGQEGLLLIVPIIWSALYLKPWKAIVSVLAVVVAELITTITIHGMAASLKIELLIVWLVVIGLVAYAIQELRQRVSGYVDQRDWLLDERQKAFVIISRTLVESEGRHRESLLMSEFVDELHGCLNADEAFVVLERYATAAFGDGGIVGIIMSPDSLVELKCNWGSAMGPAVFPSSQCRAIRTGQPHDSRAKSQLCTHLSDGTGWNYCIPLIAHGEILGVLSLKVPAESETAEFGHFDAQHWKDRSHRFAEQTAMSLANFTLRERLQALSIRDPLTGLYNRRFMEETLAREIVKARDVGDTVVVVQIDVDHFKDFNDSFGHDVGDSVLCSIGQALDSHFRESDVACRSGGEEFTLILPGTTLTHTESRLKHLQNEIARIRIPGAESDEQVPLVPTVSLGVATFPDHASTPRDLLRAGDRALYQAKKFGRNRIEHAS